MTTKPTQKIEALYLAWQEALNSYQNAPTDAGRTAEREAKKAFTSEAKRLRRALGYKTAIVVSGAETRRRDKAEHVAWLGDEGGVVRGECGRIIQDARVLTGRSAPSCVNCLRAIARGVEVPGPWA